MTVPTTDDRVSYVGNGSTTAYSFEFRVIDSADLKVFKDSVEQAGSAYTVKLNVSGVGGTVTFSSAPANGVAVSIVRETDLLQEDHFQGNDALPPATIERMVDKLTIIAQQFSSQLAAAVRLAASIDPETVNTILPDWESGKLIGWNLDSDDRALRNVDPLVALNDALPGGGAGNVIGPASSTNNAVAVFDGTNGRTLKNGVVGNNDGDVLTWNSSTGLWGAEAIPATPPAEPYVVPSGTLGFYFDATHVPTGWEVCTGQTVTINGSSFVTPDCRGRYLLCAAVSDSGSTGHTGSTVRPKATGGLTDHTHTQQGTFGSTTSSPGGSTTAQAGFTTSVQPAGALSHNHNVTISGPTGLADSGWRPVSVAALLAIKVDE